MTEWITTTTLLDGLGESGNEAAWERFVRRFSGPIGAFLRELGVPAADAEDVAQETLMAFTRALREGAYDRGRGRLSSWLFGIAFRQAQRQRRSRARRGTRESGGDPVEVKSEAPAEDLWNRHWDAFVVRECLARARGEFPPMTWLAFERVVLAERSPSEAAAELDMSVKAVYNAKHRVLKRLRILRDELEGAG